MDDPTAELTVRAHEGAPATPLARSAWRFARREAGTAIADPTSVLLRDGFEPGKIYECFFEAQDPPLVGLGFTAVRDTAAFLRFAAASEGNPCAGALDRAYVIGVSQSGRFLRHLLYLGLDEDERGRPVFDGVIPHVAGARRGEFNCRFGQPSLNASQALGSVFPFTFATQDDPVSGQSDGLLGRLQARGTMPKIFATNTAAEYWRGDGSLVHTDVRGTRDVETPANVRVYLFAGSQHTPGALPPPLADPNTGARGRHVFNVVDYAPLLRAALVNLDRWVSDDVGRLPRALSPASTTGRPCPGKRRARSSTPCPACAFPIASPAPSASTSGPTPSAASCPSCRPRWGHPS